MLINLGYRKKKFNSSTLAYTIVSSTVKAVVANYSYIILCYVCAIIITKIISIQKCTLDTLDTLHTLHTPKSKLNDSILYYVCHL